VPLSPTLLYNSKKYVFHGALLAVQIMGQRQKYLHFILLKLKASHNNNSNSNSNSNLINSTHSQNRQHIINTSTLSFPSAASAAGGGDRYLATMARRDISAASLYLRAATP